MAGVAHVAVALVIGHDEDDVGVFGFLGEGEEREDEEKGDEFHEAEVMLNGRLV